jgi:hypothetical protein
MIAVSWRGGLAESMSMHQPRMDLTRSVDSSVEEIGVPAGNEVLAGCCAVARFIGVCFSYQVRADWTS